MKTGELYMLRAEKVTDIYEDQVAVSLPNRVHSLAGSNMTNLVIDGHALEAGVPRKVPGELWACLWMPPTAPDVVAGVEQLVTEVKVCEDEQNVLVIGPRACTLKEYVFGSDRWVVGSTGKREGVCALTTYAYLNQQVYFLGNSKSDRAVETYALATRTWTFAAPMPSGRRECATVTCRNRLYAIGGLSSQGVATNTMDCFDGHAWTSKPGMVGKRWGHSAVAVQHYIYVFGGMPVALGEQLVECYNCLTEQWSVVATMDRQYFSAICAVDHFVYLFGGMVSRSAPPSGALTRFDVLTHEWRTLVPMPTPRHSLGVVLVGHSIMAVGGRHADSQPSNAMECYDLLANTWRKCSDLPGPCWHPVAIPVSALSASTMGTEAIVD